jgi:pimeloyl-ACP methyl ester carboxylesterase
MHRRGVEHTDRERPLCTVHSGAVNPSDADPALPTPSAPEWFTRAVNSPFETGDIVVDAVPIQYRAWGDPGASGLLLVHGGAAHSGWWDHIAPLLATTHRVVALDLSGHGDGGRRERYTLDGWADEVMAVATAAGIAEEPIIVGHSMGGFVTLRAAVRYGSRLGGAVVLDSPVREMTAEEIAAREQVAFGPLKVYPSRTAILGRFRPIPDDGPFLAYVMQHIADRSVREVEGGWSWKFDPAIFARAPLSPQLISRLDCRVAVFRSERGILSEEMGLALYDRLGGVAPVVEIPDAGHHVMLDQPLALVTGLRTLLADWGHSIPSAG